MNEWIKENFKPMAWALALATVIEWFAAGYAIYTGSVGLWWACATFGVIGTLLFIYWVTTVRRDLEKEKEE